MYGRYSLFREAIYERACTDEQPNDPAGEETRTYQMYGTLA